MNLIDEKQRSKPQSSLGVEVHLSGAARLIRVCSHEYKTASEQPETDVIPAMHRLVRESFIFHVATSLPFLENCVHDGEIETAFRLAEEAVCPHFHPEFSSHPNSPVLGFPPKLFRYVYTVFRLYQSSIDNDIDHQQCRNLDETLSQWFDRITVSGCEPLDREAASVNDEDDTLSIAPRPEIINPLQNSLNGPKLYILGSRILLRRMSPGLHREKQDLRRLLEEGMEAVRQLQPGKDYFAEYYCWPFLAIGINLDDPSDQNFLWSQMRAFWMATNNGTMKRLADMLVQHWHADQRIKS